MTRARLNEICAEHGLTVDCEREGAGKFRDLYIGTGKPVADLLKLKAVLIQENGCENLTKIDRVSNPEHEQAGEFFLNVGSFWNE